MSNSPEYYKKLGVELKDILKVFVSDMEGVQAHYVSNILKYLWRMNLKHDSPAQDISKAIKYSEFLATELNSLQKIHSSSHESKTVFKQKNHKS